MNRKIIAIACAAMMTYTSWPLAALQADDSKNNAGTVPEDVEPLQQKKGIPPLIMTELLKKSFERALASPVVPVEFKEGESTKTLYYNESSLEKNDSVKLMEVVPSKDEKRMVLKGTEYRYFPNPRENKPYVYRKPQNTSHNYTARIYATTGAAVSLSELLKSPPPVAPTNPQPGNTPEATNQKTPSDGEVKADVAKLREALQKEFSKEPMLRDAIEDKIVRDPKIKAGGKLEAFEKDKSGWKEQVTREKDGDCKGEEITHRYDRSKFAGPLVVYLENHANNPHSSVFDGTPVPVQLQSDCDKWKAERQRIAKAGGTEKIETTPTSPPTPPKKDGGCQGDGCSDGTPLDYGKFLGMAALGLVGGIVGAVVLGTFTFGAPLWIAAGMIIGAIFAQVIVNKKKIVGHTNDAGNGQDPSKSAADKE